MTTAPAGRTTPPTGAKRRPLPIMLEVGGGWPPRDFFHYLLLRVIGKRSVAGWREKSRPLSCKDRWRPPASLPCGVCCRSVAEGGGVRDLREADDDSARAGACGAERSQPARAARPRTSTAFEFRAAGLDFVTGAGERFEMRFFERLPDWRKVGWIAVGLFFLYCLGRVTMWLRGVD